ncbi:uncharacterized protein [Drosophila bipectinata]|uniref:uncharacterized protein n=1 Tax=Drosophila bipectinata TaxID=42026 RepID=UPI001C8A1A70|nr:uncharacterized protein LOC108132909 [Drosophila bipectinata]
MAITRPELVFLFVWLFLVLDLNLAARLPSDRPAVFPSNSEPNGAVPIMLESRQREIDLELQEVIRQMNMSLVMPTKMRKGLARTTESENRSERPGNANEETRNATESIKNAANEKSQIPSSESKMITFAKEQDSTEKPLWAEMDAVNITDYKPNVVIGPRITLETQRVCPEGTIRSEGHCRKIA